MKTSDDMIDTLAEFGHPIDVKLMAQELRARRAADLTAEEREALEDFVRDSGEPHTYGDAPIMRNVGLVGLTRLLADGQQLKAGEK